MLEHEYADPYQVAREALSSLVPPERQSVAEYAVLHRHLSNQGGGYVGRWHHEKAPYLVAPMETLTRLDYLTTVVVGPGQSGKTEIAQNWLLKSVANDPADMLWYMQTDPGLESYVKSRINPMIDSHPEMARRLGSRPIDDSLHFKRFDGMRVEFLSAAPNNVINKSAPRIVADEVDAYDPSLGDIKTLLDVRRQTFQRQSMLLAMSHPDRARGLVPDRDWSAGIMAMYGDSDRRIWYWPCPHCGAWSSPVPIAPRHMTLHYDENQSLDEIEKNTRLLCPVNGCLIEDRERRGMNVAAFRSPFGGWIGDGQEISQDGVVTGELAARKSAGFWIVGTMSPFILGGIGGLARAKVKAERELEMSGDDMAIRQVMVKQFGFPYAAARGVGSIDANVLAERADSELKLGTVPEGVRFLVTAVDCQIAHFEWLTRGFGVDGESWVIDKGRIPGDPATSAEDWDQIINLITRTYPLADGSGRAMPVRALGFDSYGQPGVTQQAYAAWRRWKKAGLARLIGKISGRDAWTVIPTKGADKLAAPRLAVVYPDTSRKANRAASSGDVPVARFNPNLFKDDLAGQLQLAEPGKLYVHFPHALRSPEQPHVWFEQLTAETRLKNGGWEKTAAGRRNEALDLMVMTHMLAQLHGLNRISWDKPPSWAKPWDTNTFLVSAAGTAVSTSTVTAPAPSSEQGAPVQKKKSAVHRYR
ncbi:phage terminase large subunit family protein [Burkholderia sp. AU42008]|uniref:phage terminase large subunit family protein n=1 Tax=unclassified Burkholderia TaxID=2613784 RepID=UPI000B7A1D4E|nr:MULTISPECIES: phage terminase large subunit family protein [unclassified Burkholderia]MBR8234613.1 phage terminase large subunit family protein [Burkholderia sp. AU32357]MBY4875944.1 phage terminase large subunit family protein [Burkholderia sp. AU42008]OXI44931.1 terminase [Burkholderia sp. AU17457]